MYGNIRWQDWYNLCLGAWLVAAPMLEVGPLTGPSAWNGYFSGALVALFSLWALVKPEKWEEWLNFAIGLWIIAAPFLLGFTTVTDAFWNHLAVGTLIVIDALWAANQRPARKTVQGRPD